MVVKAVAIKEIDSISSAQFRRVAKAVGHSKRENRQHIDFESILDCHYSVQAPVNCEVDELAFVVDHNSRQS